MADRQAMPATDRLRVLIQQSLDPAPHSSATIVSIGRRDSHYRSSYPLEEVTLTLADGSRVELMVKSADRAGLTPIARDAKPAVLHDPHREIEVYRTILAGARMGTARYYAGCADPATGEYWLCIETVPGVELYQVGELQTWQMVAEWLADFHSHFATDSSWRAGAATPHLLTIDQPSMQSWFDRAVQFANEREDDAVVSALTSLGPCWQDVVMTLSSAPRTLLHGEFYASNVLVDTARMPARVCPIDWEMAADGPGVIDLAALIAGDWPHDEPDRIVDAYRAAAMRHDRAMTRSSFDHALACARIYVAVQWLGWARDWTPPADHDHDWASTLARQVTLLGA